MFESLNWKMMTDETVQNLVRLIRQETINPPGNELAVILVVKSILEEAGFPSDAIKIVESAPNRANLIARIKGDGSERPLLLSGHVDVVPAEKEHWSHDPFGGEVIDGMVWGRGALDMKGFLAMYLETFLSLFRQKISLKRDVILAAIADEEGGFTYGSGYLVEQHRELIGAEYAITEGGALTYFVGKNKFYPIQVAEKGTCWLRAKAYGKAGHSANAPSDNAVLFLAQALDKIRRARHLPVHITPTFLKMVDATSSQIPSLLNQLIRLLNSPIIANLLLNSLKGETQNLLQAFVSNTVSPTVLHAGDKYNLTPRVAEAGLDCRLLPGQNQDDVIKEIHQIVGEGIELEPILVRNGAEFSIETALFKLIKERTSQLDPEGLVVPVMAVGGTDASQYQRLGMTVYGFTPGILPVAINYLQLVHGQDERIPISFIQTGLPVLWDVLTEFCGKS